MVTTLDFSIFLKGSYFRSLFRVLLKKFFRSKNKVLGPVKIPKKTFIEFFLRFLGDFVPVLKGKKWYLSNLVPVLKVNSEYLKNKNLIFHY
jgi:hypothetical protein